MKHVQDNFQLKSTAVSASNRVLDVTCDEPKSTSRRASSRHASPRYARRRGQALLISVLLMVFTAVLGATFVTVVALNLSQTARSGSVNTARANANAGLVFVNNQLTNSVEGERWRPTDVTTAAAVGDAYYYTDYERAQGWDQVGYVKLPDPRSTSITGNNTPTYLTKVEPVSGGDRDGQLKLTVIGRAPNDDAASFKLTAYKPTSRTGNFTTPALLVSNWNFGQSRDENIRRLTNPATAPDVELAGGLDKIDASGDGIAVNNKDTNLPIQSAGGDAFIYGNLRFFGKSAFKFDSPKDLLKVTGNINVGSAIAKVTTDNVTFTDIASSNRVVDAITANDPTSPTGDVRLITPARIDSPNSKWLQKTKQSGDPGADLGYGEGVYINNPDDVEKVEVSTGAGAYGYGRVSWRSLDIAETQRLLQRKSFQALSTEYGNVANPTTANIVYSNAAANTDKGEYAAGNVAHRLSWPRAVPSPLVSPLPLPYSFPIVPDGSVTPPPTARLRDPSLEERGLRGWISPTEFLPRGVLVELRGDAVVITRDDLSDQSQWKRDSDGDVINANVTPTKVIDARVPGDELQPNPNYNIPDVSKAWKQPNGIALPIGARTYKMTLRMDGVRLFGPNYEFQVPAVKQFNGVIYAEGNVRVRGFCNANMKDLTIVSMGNIYVEGGINQAVAGRGNVALLAKKNVILNPTQFAARPAGMQIRKLTTVLQTSPSASTGLFPNGTPDAFGQIFVPVLDVSIFRVGDSAVFGAQPQTWIVKDVTPSGATSGPGQITLYTSTSSTLSSAYGEQISVLTDPPLTGDGVLPASNKQPRRIDGGMTTFMRNLMLDGSPTSGAYHLATVHAGERRIGVQIEHLTPGSGDVNIKPDTSLDNIIQGSVGTNEKQLSTTGSSGSPFDLTATPNDNLSGPVSLLNTFTTPPDPNWRLSGATASRSYRLAAANWTATGITLPRDFLLTTSVGAYWKQNTDFAALILPATSYDFAIGSSFNPQDPEDVGTVREGFYGVYDVNNLRASQAGLQGTSHVLSSAPTSSGDNFVALRRAETPDDLANYFVSSVKYDRVNLAAVATDPVQIKVQATIYAQEGSWFVIPMPAMTPSDATANQAYRYRRLNYQIVINSTIAEKFLPTALNDVSTEQTPDQFANSTVSLGAQAQWLDASSYPSTVVGSNPTVWQTINYVAPAPLPLSNTLYLPITPDYSIVR